MSAVTGSEIVLRGDTRTPQAIEAAGGLYSQRVGQALPTQAVGPGTPMSAHRGPTVMEEYVHNPHDPDAHQAFAHATRFVSCTRDIGIAKGFATPHGHVYLARANVGVDYNAYRGGGNAGQAEVMVIQGLAMNDIIAARRMADNAIFVNSTFQQANMPQATFNAAMNLLMG
ncbi:hypothetical protein RM190_01850 [Paracoccus sp. CPCC 101403]|uniref:Uncharacterized protein n=2 Tax=Paracoccus broussonetiae TaxID=3075834 RepID=A0ABU3E8T0_9RHOB|nr:hypothetical protein [Paracoccus sp. CPCC 101403]MDT1060580.1 hypothetical protein [Paracoccus sp. CPCC 101403]